MSTLEFTNLSVTYGLEPVRRWLAKQPERTVRLRIVVRSLDFVGYQDPVTRHRGFFTPVEPTSPPSNLFLALRRGGSKRRDSPASRSPCPDSETEKL